VTALVVLWLAGLAAGFFAILSAAARFSCGHTDQAIACRSTGTALGVVITLGVIAVVTVITVLTYDSSPRRILSWTALGILLLAGCYLCAQALLATV
jgi:hypothetical protein